MACLPIASMAQAQVITFGYTGSASTLTITSAGIYEITVAGAQGGNGGNSKQGGAGAIIIGDYSFAAGDVLNLVVGGQGGSSTNSGGGGGGGSFVFDTSTATLVVVAGGGGGAGSFGGGGAGGQITTFGSSGSGAGAGAGGANGNGGQANPNNHGGGGGGFLTSGQNSSNATGGGAYPSLAGGVNTWGEPGGYGGGGAGSTEGGGGGGYSGGGGGSGYNRFGGGGGGSFEAAGFTLVSATAGAGGNSASMTGNLGNGFISFTLLQLILSPISAGNAFVASSLGVYVMPSFQGGTLTMDQAGTYSQNFTLDNSGTSKINQNGNNSTFTGNFTNATTGGALIIANTGLGGSVTFGGQSTYTGITKIQNGAALVAGATNTFSQASLTQIAAGGVLNLNGYAQSINNVTLAGGAIENGALTGAISSTGGAVYNISGAASLTASSGVTMLSGANTYAGATTINGGTLIAGSSGAFSASSAFTVAAPGALDLGGYDNSIGSLSGAGIVTNSGFANATLTVRGLSTPTTFSGVIANGANYKVGLTVAGGSLTLSGANTYTGATNVNVGSLTLSGGIGQRISLSGPVSVLSGAAMTVTSIGSLYAATIFNSGAITVDNGGALTANGGVTNNASGAITVAAGGTFTDDLNNAGAVTNNGVYNANVASNTGTITNNATWNGSITTSGALTSTGLITGGVTNTGAVNATGAIGGPIANNAGTFNVTGTLADRGSFSNASGATVAIGSNALSTTQLNNAGRVTAANGAIAGNVANIGTLDISSSASNRLSVIGAMSFAAGSAYQISVTPASASLTNVQGATTLSGGALLALGGGTSYANYTRYTILTATGGVSGVFEGVTTNVSFLTPSLTYDANDVYLVMVRNDVNYASMANTPNQVGVANALNRGEAATKGLNPILNSVDMVSNNPANMPAVLDQLSGAGLAGAENLAFQAGALFTSTISDQNRSWLSGGKGANEITLGGPNGLMAYAPAPNGPPGDAVLGSQRTWRVWSGGYASGATFGDDRSAGAYAQTNANYGGALGIDYQVQPGLLLGFAGGYSDGSFGVRRLGTSGHLEGGQFGFYGAATSGSLYGFASTAFSSFNNHTTRYVLAFGNLFAEKNNASFNSRELREHLEFGRRYVIGGATLTPYVKVDLATLWSDGFLENNGAGGTNMAGLSVANRQTLSAPGSIGVRLEQAFALGGMKIIPWGDLAYVHEFSPQREIYGTFVNLPSATFGVNAAQVGRDAVQVRTGVKLAITETSSIFASFDDDFSRKSSFYAGKGGAQVNW
ncbi:uncharacterized protein with beta-barrel porin domain [Rhodoblastus sphagnicola]|nr:autotransporter domain-containing protein [Rhodoblastus sphagnicola]MBB4200823.1 uncharacterized protein with beta-barrel porin domain [Rhodoblastus sphagnicola]